MTVSVHTHKSKWKHGRRKKRAKQAKQAKLGLPAAHGRLTDVLEAILHIRQNCCDPLLLLDGIEKKDAKNEEAQDDLMYNEERDDTGVKRTALPQHVKDMLSWEDFYKIPNCESLYII